MEETVPSFITSATGAVRVLPSPAMSEPRRSADPAGGIPRYADLPRLGKLKLRHSRDVLPPQLGTLSFIGPQQTAEAAGLVRDGVTMPLNLPVDAFEPPLFGRERLVHRVIEPGRNESEDVLDSFNPQASSQIDGLGHVRAREYGYYDGSTDLESARGALGMERWAERGIAGRGVLLDMKRIEPDPFSGRGFTVKEVLSVAAEQGVELRRGDTLLVRTGWAPGYLSCQLVLQSMPMWNGLKASEAMAEFLWDRGIAAVGSDNPAVENSPGNPSVGSLHRRLIPALGMPLFELLQLEQLTSYAREHGRWEFFFVSVPLNVRGAVSSPANAMAMM